MTTPVQVGLTALPVLVGALGCFDRIETYLNQPPSEASKRDSQSQACRSWEKGRDFTLDEVCIELEGKQILHNFTHCFPAESISLIVGPSGAGKTTILNAMLAELPVKSGLISTPPSSVAYCSQEPWVRNSSMRHAICGEALWEQDWYKEVIQACFPDGAPEMPGDSTQMSEGQRKKLVSLAERPSIAPITDMTCCKNVDLIFFAGSCTRSVFSGALSPSGRLLSWDGPWLPACHIITSSWSRWPAKAHATNCHIDGLVQ